MRGFFLTILIGLLVFSAIAADTDQFDIVVQCHFLDISLKESASHTTDFTEWDMGMVAAGSGIDIMPVPDHIWVDNGYNVNINVSAYLSSPTPSACGYGTATPWTPGSSAGADQFMLDLGIGDASTQPSVWTNITSTSTPGDIYETVIPAGDDHDLYARFQVPTTVSDGCPHTITVYIVATPF